MYSMAFKQKKNGKLKIAMLGNQDKTSRERVMQEDCGQFYEGKENGLQDVGIEMADTYINKRINYIDCLKGLGMLLIVLGHTLKNGYVWQFIFAFHVPLFFFASGLTYRMKANKRKYYAGKVKRILIPYYSFSVLSIFLYELLGTVAAEKLNVLESSANVYENIFGMLYGNSRTNLMQWNQPLWFLPCIFCSYILADAAETIICKVKRKMAIRLGMMVGSLLITYVYVYFKVKIPLPFGIESAIFMFSFFEMGILAMSTGAINKIYLYIKRHRECVGILGCISLVICCLLSFYNGFAQVRTMNIGSSLIVTCLGAAFGIISFLIVSILLENNAFLRLCGRKSMPILLIHKFFILFFQTLCPITREWLKNGNSVLGILSAVVVSIVVIILSLICGKLIRKICPAIISG